MAEDSKIIRGIYKITCDVTSDCYIGMSTNITNRWSQHLEDLKNGSKSFKFKNLIEKYGLKAFSFKILDENDSFTKDELLKLEASYILNLKPSLNTSIPKINDSGIILDSDETWKEREFNRIWNGLKFVRSDRRGVITTAMFYEGYVNKTKYPTVWKFLDKLYDMKLTGKVKLGDKDYCNYVISNINGIKMYNMPVDSKDGKRYIFIYIDENSIQKLLKML